MITLTTDAENSREETLEDLNVRIHNKALNSLNTKVCPKCGKGYYNVPFHRNICKICHNAKKEKFTAANAMDIGPSYPELEGLTLAERLMVTPLHVSAYIIRLRGGQFAISGHTMLFKHDINNVIMQLPRIDLPIAILERVRTDGRCEHLKVRPEKVLRAIRLLKQINPAFETVIIDDSVFQHRGNEYYFEADRFDDDSCLEDSALYQDSANMDTSVPPARIRTRDGAPIINFPPKVHDEPINEFRTKYLCCLGFPLLFPDGRGEYFREDPWPVIKLSFKEWALHLFSHSEPRFRESIEFKFWCWSFITRTDTMRSSKLVLKMIIW